jgi:hypothetical protein
MNWNIAPKSHAQLLAFKEVINESICTAASWKSFTKESDLNVLSALSIIFV